MAGLSDADRAALLVPCECGHTINDHGSLCWLCSEESEHGCQRDFEALLIERLAGIVQAAVNKALTEAAGALDAMAGTSYLHAAEMVRARIPN